MTAVPRRQLLVFLTVVALSVLTGVLHFAEVEPVVTFVVAGVALAGIASVVAFATDAVGESFGHAVTGVLQSTLGNLPELFIVLFALSAGEIVVAQTSIIGSLLANALLVLGLAIVAGARQSGDGVMRFHARLANDTTSLMLMAIFIISLLGLSGSAADPASRHQRAISVIGAVCLLAVYLLWLYGYVREGAGRQEARAEGLGAHRVSLAPAITMLAVSGVLAALVSDWFVHALSPAAESLGLSKAFVGIVIVAIAGNAVENTTGILLAAKGKSDLAVSVVYNSVSQIAVFLFPVLVLVSQLFETPLTFALAPVYIGALLLMAVANWQITGDGAAAAFEGAALVALYVILATFAFYE